MAELFARYTTGHACAAAACTVDELPFAHAFAALPQSSSSSLVLDVLLADLLALAFRAAPLAGGSTAGSFNLVMGPEWVLLVPRSRREFAPTDGAAGAGTTGGTVDVNGLGFVGSLLVRGAKLPAPPIEILRGVAVTAASAV